MSSLIEKVLSFDKEWNEWFKGSAFENTEVILYDYDNIIRIDVKALEEALDILKEVVESMDLKDDVCMAWLDKIECLIDVIEI